MAKKFVRGITDIKNIEHQDFDTNNVNDLLSDGKHNYIHRKKQDGSEEYHNLTNNIKTIESSNTSLLSVTNYNNTTNSARLTPKHDRRKEQLLESTDETIVISHGENGTDETTSVDVNPEIVLEHDNLVSNSQYVTIEHEEGSNTSVISTDKLDSDLKIVGLRNYVLGSGTAKSVNEGILYDLSTAFVDVPDGEPFIIEFDWSVTAPTATSKFRIQRVIGYSDETAEHGISYSWQNLIKEGDVPTAQSSGHYYGTFMNDIDYDRNEVVSRYLHLYQSVSGGTVTISNLSIRRGYLKSDWVCAPEDTTALLEHKQDTLTSNTSIGVDGTGLMQLYSYQMSYSNPLEGCLNTYAKTVKKDTNLTSTPKIEFHFLAKLNDGIAGMSVELEDDDVSYFTSILTKYGEASASGKTAMINGLLFTLNGSQLTVSRDTSTSTYNQVVTFSDII